jgi:hypothetical protein
MPENAITDSTPGSAPTMSLILWITASVRLSEAASGSCAKAMT